MNTVANKAVAGFIVALATLLGLAHIEMPAILMDPNVQAVLTAVVVGAITYLVPNKKVQNTELADATAKVVAVNVQAGSKGASR